MIDEIALTRTLISTPSPVRDGDEVAVAGVVTDVLRQIGAAAPRVIAREPRRPNLVATIDFGAGGSHLALCGHLDTKPVGDAAWTVDPFAADIDGDRLYGLGSGDMKAGIAAMLAATERLLITDPPSRGRLSLILTADEENGAELGAKHLAPRLGIDDLDLVVIGEPGGIEADFDRLHTVSRGLSRFALQARAAQGHSSLSSSLGMRNAGVDLAHAIVAVADARLDLPDAPLGVAGWEATVNAALRIDGGIGYGVLPEALTALVEVRTLPGMDDDRIAERLAERAAAVNAQRGSDVRLQPDTAGPGAIPATWVDPSSPLVGAVLDAVESALGTRLPVSVFPGTTDATWFDLELGVPCLPALGPGLLRRAHGADEWVSIRATRQAVDLYESIARTILPAGAQ